MIEIPAPALRPVLRLQVEVGPPIALGRLNGLERRMVPILGGRADGAFSGHILPGGHDVQAIHDDGTIELLARYALDLGDGGKLLLENTGLRRASRPESRPNEAAYFRGRMRFDAPAGALGWLNNTVFLTSGHREGNVVHIEVFEVE